MNNEFPKVKHKVIDGHLHFYDWEGWKDENGSVLSYAVCRSLADFSLDPPGQGHWTGKYSGGGGVDLSQPYQGF